MGRFVNRPYRNYSLFISEAASLFNIHLFPCVIPVASRQHRAKGNICGRTQFAPTCQMRRCSIPCQRQPSQKAPLA